LVACASAALACSEDVQLAHAARQGGDAGASADASHPSQRQPADCASARTELARIGADAGACAPPAAQPFRYALCTCSDATFADAFSTDAFDSTDATGTVSGYAASLGIDGQLVVRGALDAAGTLITTGAGELPIIGSSFHVAGNFESNGNVIMSGGDVQFDRDAWIDGDVLAIGANVRIAGDLVQTPGHTGAETVTIGGSAVAREFEIAPPCACGDDILDIAAAVSEAETENDNDAVEIARDALYALESHDTLALPCGRFVFDGGVISAAPQLSVHARTSIFVDGDLAIAADFQPEFGSAGELDVFVRGDLAISGGVAVGTPSRPAALRFYVAGPAAIAVAGPLAFAAGLYAPRAAVLTSSAQELYGALFVDSYSAVGDQRVHYDRALLPSTDSDDACTSAGMPACTDDLGCVPPMLCTAGQCTSRLAPP
jgi:hypothetical protein